MRQGRRSLLNRCLQIFTTYFFHFTYDSGGLFFCLALEVIETFDARAVADRKRLIDAGNRRWVISPDIETTGGESGEGIEPNIADLDVTQCDRRKDFRA